MKATARRDGSGFRHTVQVRDHQLTVDELVAAGGDDSAPDPQELLAASLASCSAITMEMYAAAQGLGPRATSRWRRVQPRPTAAA